MTTTEWPTSTAEPTTSVETMSPIETTTEGTTSTTETLTTVWGTSAIEATTEGPTSTAEETTSTIEATSYDQTTFTAETSSIVETTNTIPTQMPTTTLPPINSPVPESPFKFVPEKLDLSVPENTSLGTELYNPILTGGFKDETHDYEFTLLMDGNGTFNLTENRAITLIRPLDYEVQRTRLILIQAHMINSSVNDSFNNIYYYDCSSFYATMEITVIVEDVDEYPMMFRYYSKSTTFGENLTTGLSDVNIPIHWVVVSSDTEVGTSIFRFTVMDPDGSPPAVTGFHITGNNSAQDFLGVTSEGEMYTTDTIPASTSVCPFGCAVQVYELLVTASQGSKEFECKVLLAVRNTRIRIEVQEDTSFVGFQIIDFVAAEGSSITDGSLSAYVNVSFPIHVIGYDLFLQSFNYEAEQEYHLLFNCTYENTSFITVPIVIQVVDVNDHSPVFDQDMYIGAVRNTTPANTTITMVSASDRDLGDNANLVYTITEGDQYFWVTDCGQLQTKTEMNFMQHSLQVIEGKVNVSDGLHSNETMVHVLVYALDLEYYIPENQTVEYLVPENQTVGNIVVPYLCGNMSAYGYASCSVLDPTGTFTMSSDHLQLVSHLDYEFNTTFTLLLNVVFDTIEMNITVTVHVLDVNDNWPFFIQQEIYTAVQNFTQENTTVAMVMAHDNDSNANLVYTITEGDHYFWVTDCGQLQTRMDMSLMPNPLQVIEGKVRVSDGVHSNETMVHVLVYALDLEYYIPENQSVGNIVVPYLCGNMSAYVYANCSVIDPTGTFAVHGDDLILDSSLDYEFNTTFTLLLNVVFDTIEMNITVTVHVLDVNDNWPFFIQQEIYTAVQNFTQENTTVAMVMAHDNDSNANLVYTITEGDHYFWVTDCGQLQTRMDMSLMPNPLQVIEGKVRVSDGVHSNETMVHVLVYALDLEYYIPENQSVGNIVVPYLCGNMSAYVYANCSVIDPTGTFAVHGDDLILDSSLDYEFNTTFTLLLNVVFDTIEMNITVTVHVLDVNDNWPFFIQQEIYTAVQNFTQENTTVAMVMAHDNDSNANLVYTITEGDHYFWVTDCGQLQTRMDMSLMPNPLQVIEGKVRVSDGVHSNETMVHVLVYALDLEYYIPENQSVGNIVVPYLCGNMSAYVYANCSVIDPTGTFAVHGDDLILDSRLDYEFNTTFTLLLNVVFDTIEMNITVTVHVLDVNDNWPFFIQQEIYTAVQNFTQENTTVAMVMAHDNDSNANLVYTITEGDHYFWVTDCGQLQTRMDMSLMPNPLQVIEGKVRVSDGVHSNETMVHVLVYALDLEYYIPENQSVGNIVVPYLCGNMSAYVYANCSVIDPTGTFAVHGDDLILDSRLDYEFNTTFTLLLIVSFDTIEMNITVTVHVLDVNDNRPVFLQQQYSVTVMREINPHTLLTTITAEDPDQNQNITYKLLGSDNENFLINNYGQVFSLSSLNFSDSVVHTVNLTVRVTDGIWTSHASLKLHIVANELKIEVSESTPNESIVHSNLCSQEFLLNGTCSIAGMDSTFGLDVDKNLVLQKLLDFESKEDYDLMLTAVTGDTTWTLPIRVHVSDTNDEIPLFQNEAHFFGIVSNSSLPNMTIFNINASDPDNVGSTLEFSLDEVGAEYFQISHCGQLQTMSSFPLQLQVPFHFVNFSISVTDGIHVTTTRARVLIATDSWQVAVAENDTENNWELQNLCGNLNTYGGSCTVTSDPEIPGLLYNASENSLHLNTRLDARIQDVYEIKVQASLVPFETITVSISINVIDVNDHVPQFTEDSYSAVLHNGAYENTVILTLEVEDGDLGNNSNIEYTITSNPFTIFGINSAGWLYTNRRLDIASILPDLNDLIAYTAQVTVEARDLGIPPKHNSTSVDVLFLDDEFVINIMENEYDIPFGNISVPALRNIGLVRAPAGISANLTHLWLAEGLDYEQSSSLHFSLNLSLDHSHYIVPVTVHVINVNDEPPEFGESIYNFTVPDGARYYTLINMTTATDRDTTDITYSLRDVEDEVSGGMSVSGLFLVNEKNGALYTNGQISYEKLLKEKRFKSENDSYLEFMIEATDGVFTANATIRVIVLQYDLRVVNQYDNTTAFLPEGNYSSTLFLVTDEAARANYSDFKFQVTPKQDELMFFINETTGFIYTNQTFDREQDDNYIVFVIALEQGLDSCQAGVIAIVNTTITDINDNPPVFTSQTYEGHVDENRTSAEVQFQMPINAPDKDIGSNALIYYKLLNGTDVFQIDNTTGKLYTSGKLDREETGFYIVMISASDGTYNDTATVNITLDDVNDNAPEFSETNYTFNVSEDHSSDKSIGQVLATDRDINILPLTYHIENDSNEKFTMKNPFTGEIWISGTLDRESLQNDRIEFLVIAKDSSSGSTTDTSHSTTATVTVIVSDVNDNSPEFGKNIDVDVLENYTGPLTQVHATDPDAGENGTVTYWLGDHDNSRFSIDNTTGNITLEQSFDFEDENPNFIRLTVYARDNGKSCQSSGSCNDTMEVMITIKDINDNPPVFLIQNIILSSPDKIGIVIPMIAFDRDSKENGDVTYSFPDYPNNTLKRFFNVSNSGIISAIKIINIQLDTNNRVLTVMAKDNGSKPLSGFATITFFGQNEETPCKLNNKIYVSNITEEQHYPWPVISLTYNKSSEEDKCIFTLSCPQDFLVINSTTGEIGLRNGSLDREELDNFFKSTWDGKTLSCVVSFYVPDKPISAAEASAVQHSIWLP
ncbi:protocadherin Fat 4 [Lingula anatina]|uniref:Protocadherin Fat 4 n=1 Tax=Lingula anatina TaxID=7574 RepID=A0A2R2MTD0_LINAN|nr:protocadherin Fat 4 [Lingula anatina]|eukprot:XP_023933499.1 protocadherin Fat 4 [Lingula anatina]